MTGWSVGKRAEVRFLRLSRNKSRVGTCADPALRNCLRYATLLGYFSARINALNPMQKPHSSVARTNEVLKSGPRQALRRDT